jgi:hypothetical protein
MYVLYTDDLLLTSPSQKEINQILIDLKKVKLDITNECNIEDFLGINIDIRKDGIVHLSQLHLINQIPKTLRMDVDKCNPKKIPTASSKVLIQDLNGIDFDESFHYRSIIDQLNYLEKGIRSDISYIIHQCTRFVEQLQESHAKA